MKWILLVLFLLVILLGFDFKFFAVKRAIGHDWESYRGKDYINTGVDIFICDKNMVNGDTLIINKKRFIIKYCAFGSLWIRDIQATYTAKYVYAMSSKDW
jgi:hypothetical protein